MEDVFRQVIEGVGEDPEREGLKETPARAARAFKTLTRGYGVDPREVIGSALFDSPNDEMVIVTNIELYSLCEHHLLPFFGHCHVGYLPRGKVVGLSKIARVVEVFSRRLQIQENMTRAIAESIMEVVEPHGVGVVVDARHLCMMMRGVEKQNSHMITSCMLGRFRTDPRTRSEFLDLIRQ